MGKVFSFRVILPTLCALAVVFSAGLVMAHPNPASHATPYNTCSDDKKREWPYDCSASTATPHGPAENPFTALPTNYRVRTGASNYFHPGKAKYRSDGLYVYQDASDIYEQSIVDPAAVGIDTFEDPSVYIRARTCYGVPVPQYPWACWGGMKESWKRLSSWGECAYIEGIRFCARMATTPGEYGNHTDTQPDYRIRGNIYVNAAEPNGYDTTVTLSDNTTVTVRGLVCDRYYDPEDRKDGLMAKFNPPTFDINNPGCYGTHSGKKTIVRYLKENGVATPRIIYGPKDCEQDTDDCTTENRSDYTDEDGQKVQYGLAFVTSGIRSGEDGKTDCQNNSDVCTYDDATKTRTYQLASSTVSEGTVTNNISNSTLVLDEQNRVVTPRIQLCVYEDPKDATDSDDPSGAGVMNSHYNTERETDFSDNSDTIAAGLGIGGAALLVVCPICAPLSILAGLAALGVWLAGLGDRYINHVVYQDEGCIDPMIGPLPGPYCDTLNSPKPTPTLEAICGPGQTLAQDGCVQAGDGISNSFAEPRIRVGFDDILPICATGVSQNSGTCVALPAINGTPSFISECTSGQQSTPANPCIQPLSGSSGGGRYRISYNLRRDPITNSISTRPLGINRAAYADLTYNYYPVSNGQTNIMDTQDPPLSRTFYISMEDPTQVCVKETNTSSGTDEQVGCIARLGMPTLVKQALPTCESSSSPQPCSTHTRPLIRIGLSETTTPSGKETQTIILGAKMDNKCETLYGVELCSAIFNSNTNSFYNGIIYDYNITDYTEPVGDYIQGGTDICIQNPPTDQYVLTRVKSHTVNTSNGSQAVQAASNDPADTLIQNYQQGQVITYDPTVPTDVTHVPAQGDTTNRVVNTTSECTVSNNVRTCTAEATRPRNGRELDLCVAIPQITPCPAITTATESTGNATWPITDAGNPGITATGTCELYYGTGNGNPPTLSCIADSSGDFGKWEQEDPDCVNEEGTISCKLNVSNICTRNRCAAASESFSIKEYDDGAAIRRYYDVTCSWPASNSTGASPVLPTCTHNGTVLTPIAGGGYKEYDNRGGTCYEVTFRYIKTCKDNGNDAPEWISSDTSDSKVVNAWHCY